MSIVNFVEGRITSISDFTFGRGWKQYSYIEITEDDGGVVRVKEPVLLASSGIPEIIKNGVHAKFWFRRTYALGTKNILLAADDGRGLRFANLSKFLSFYASLAALPGLPFIGLYFDIEWLILATGVLLVGLIMLPFLAASILGIFLAHLTVGEIRSDHRAAGFVAARVRNI